MCMFFNGLTWSFLAYSQKDKIGYGVYSTFVYLGFSTILPTLRKNITFQHHYQEAIQSRGVW